MAQNGTKQNNFKLSTKQRKIAEKLVDPEFYGTVTELCEEFGVPRRTYYNWLENPDFRGYMESLIDKYADSELSTVWKALIEQCARGNVKAIKLYFEMRGMTGTSQNKNDDVSELHKALDGGD